MLRIAVLGCGRIGQMHAANVARHPRAELVAVYEIYGRTDGLCGGYGGSKASRWPLSASSALISASGVPARAERTISAGS